MEGSQHLLRRIPLLVTVAALLASCGGESGEEEAVEIPMPGAALECERVGYPCSMADVPIEVIEQSDAIGDEILSMLDTGASIADVNTWLADQDNVVEVQWDGSEHDWGFRGLTTIETPSNRQCIALLQVVK